MKSENFNVSSDDGAKLFVYRWLPDNSNKIKAVVHVIHGMGEHAGRYAEFAQNLTEDGFAVYSMDQRRHGRTAEDPKNFGHYADENRWRLVLHDLKILTGIINKHYKNKGVFLFGHSAGSFLARDYLASDQALSDKQFIKGAVLSGSTCSPGLLGHFGILLAKNIIRKHGPETKSMIHLKLTFEKYNSYFKPNNTDYDWITRDKKKVEQILQDPYYYRLFSAAFYLDMIEALFRINDSKNIAKIPKDMPILFISGTHDALGGFKKGITRVFKDYKKAGINDVTLKFYQDARHELVSEINRKEVYRDIIGWLNSKLTP